MVAFTSIWGEAPSTARQMGTYRGWLRILHLQGHPVCVPQSVQDDRLGGFLDHLGSHALHGLSQCVARARLDGGGLVGAPLRWVDCHRNSGLDQVGSRESTAGCRCRWGEAGVEDGSLVTGRRDRVRGCHPRVSTTIVTSRYLKVWTSHPDEPRREATAISIPGRLIQGSGDDLVAAIQRFRPNAT